jgi:plastocyanin domain-containing protein
MDSTEIFVVIAGIATITFVLWYFFGERRRMAAAIGESGVQEIQVTLKGGYSPDLIVVREGGPVRLNFYRDETASCSDQIFGLARDLPAYKGEGGRVHLHLRHADDARQTYRGSE